MEREFALLIEFFLDFLLDFFFHDFFTFFGLSFRSDKFLEFLGFAYYKIISSLILILNDFNPIFHSHMFNNFNHPKI